jgi:hypothetical protein
MVKPLIIPGLDHSFLDGQWLPTPNYHMPTNVKKIDRKLSAKERAQGEAKRRTIPIPLGDGLATW